MKIKALPIDLRVALLYALFGGLWIVFSDWLLAAIVSDISTFTTLQIYKGWVFVAVSAALIFTLLRRELSLRRISEERFKQTLDNMLEGCQIIGFDWRYLYLNDAAVSQSGKTRQALLGHTMLEAYPGLENTQLYTALRRCMEERRSHRMENEFEYPDGRIGWFDLSIQPAPEGLFILSIDITERRRAEEKLRGRETLLRLILDTSPAVIFVKDRDSTILEANRRMAGFYNLSVADVIGRRQSDLHRDLGARKEDAEQWLIDDREVIDTGEIKCMIESGVDNNNQMHWFETTKYPIDIGGGRKGVLVFSEDITERKQAEQALRKNEELYRKLAENFPNGSVNLYDRDLRMTFVAGGDLKKYNTTPDKFIGKTFQQLAPAETFAIAEPHLRAAFKGQTGSYETPYWDNRYYLVNVAPIVDPDGSINQIMVVVQNHTERKRAEEEVRLQRDRLAALSRRLAEARESESRFIGRELHDQIGQMLTGLKLLIEIALQMPAEQTAKKLAQAQELIDDLMRRVSSLSLELRPPMLDDLGLVPALLWRIGRYHEQTGIPVNFKHSGVEHKRFFPELETTVFRIIQEAMTNAARHAQATQVELEVRVQEGRMEIRVRDDGRGFEPQVGFDQNRGLSGMRERAELLDGSLRVESQAGKGTDIFIRLPLQEEIR